MTIKRLFVLFAAAMMLCSCGAYKRLAFLQDMEVSKNYEARIAPDARIAKGDKLSIFVTSSEPVMASPFNLVTGTSEYNNVSKEEGFSLESQSERGYLVDKYGNINFPVLGRIYVEGMTLDDLTETIESRIVASGLLTNPIVMAEFTNFQITMLGEVAGIGNYTVRDGDINIFEALAMAGGPTMDAQNDKVWVIRTIGDTRKVFSLDLKSKSCYDSPAFYLQQNDMVYVLPRNSKMDSTTSNRFTITSTMVSVLGVLSNLLLWVTVYSR